MKTALMTVDFRGGFEFRHFKTLPDAVFTALLQNGVFESGADQYEVYVFRLNEAGDGAEPIIVILVKHFFNNRIFNTSAWLYHLHTECAQKTLELLGKASKANHRNYNFPDELMALLPE